MASSVVFLYLATQHMVNLVARRVVSHCFLVWPHLSHQLNKQNASICGFHPDAIKTVNAY